MSIYYHHEPSNMSNKLTLLNLMHYANKSGSFAALTNSFNLCIF